MGVSAERGERADADPGAVDILSPAVAAVTERCDAQLRHRDSRGRGYRRQRDRPRGGRHRGYPYLGQPVCRERADRRHPADLAGSPPAGGGVTLDSTSSDIQPLGATAAAGSNPQAASSTHIHPLTGVATSTALSAEVSRAESAEAGLLPAGGTATSAYGLHDNTTTSANAVARAVACPRVGALNSGEHHMLVADTWLHLDELAVDRAYLVRLAASIVVPKPVPPVSLAT